MKFALTSKQEVKKSYRTKCNQSVKMRVNIQSPIKHHKWFPKRKIQASNSVMNNVNL